MARPAGVRRDRLGTVLLLACLVVPCLFLALSGWVSWRQTWRAAFAGIDLAAEAVAEYGLRVLGAHAIAAGRVDALLRGLSDQEIRAREASLHDELRALTQEMPQAESSYVIDRHGGVLVNGSQYPAPRGTRPAADRDFFLALAAPDAPALHVSRVYTSRVDGQDYFAVSRRRLRTGNDDLPDGEFDGLISTAVDPARLSGSLRRIATRNPAAVVALVRTDGEILARSHPLPVPTRVSGPFAASIATAADTLIFETVSTVDGDRRLFALRRIDGWPVFAAVAWPRSAVVEAWRRQMAGPLAIAVSGMVLLLGLALLMRRSHGAALRARAMLEERVAARSRDLAEKEALLRSALVVGRVFASEYSAAEDVVMRSPNAADILGLPSGRALREAGAEYVAAIHPDDLGALRSSVGRLTPVAPRYRTCFRYSRRDGDTIWLEEEGVGEFGPDERLLHLTSLVRDVTVEHEASRAAREAQLRLRAATEGAGIGIYEIDFRGERAWLDHQAAAVLGGIVPAERWIGLGGAEWAALDAAIHPEDVAAYQEAWRKVASGESPGWSLESRVRHPDGRWTWEWCHGIALEPDPRTGCPARLVGILRDVTERREMEDELRQAQKLQAVGTLASGIAHDFNNVLQAIEAAASLAGRHAEEPTAVRRRLQVVQDAVARGAAITRRLLDFARRKPVKAEPLDVGELLRGLRDLLASTLGAGYLVQAEVPDALPKLLGDAEQIQTALINLATNARDAMPEGGMLVLRARRDEAGPEATGLPPGLAPGDYVRLSVQDTGAGMDAATLARVTEPFFTTKPAGKGTGLGIPLAKGLAERAGGAFAIESAPGEGTTVSLWFPCAPPVRSSPCPRP
jgi:signal transduction histidine kinase